MKKENKQKIIDKLNRTEHILKEIIQPDIKSIKQQKEKFGKRNICPSQIFFNEEQIKEAQKIYDEAVYLCEQEKHLLPTEEKELTELFSNTLTLLCKTISDIDAICYSNVNK